MRNKVDLPGRSNLNFYVSRFKIYQVNIKLKRKDNQSIMGDFNITFPVSNKADKKNQ